MFYALDVPLNLKTDLRGSEYLAARSKAITNFHRKHPGSRVTGLRNMQFIEGDAEW